MIRFRCMNTDVTLQTRGPQTEEVSRSLACARASLYSAEAELSRFREDSGLSRLNRSAGLGPRSVSPLLFDVVDAAVQIALGRDGLFDPTIGDALCEAGYDASFETLQLAGPAWWRTEEPLTPPAGTARGSAVADIGLDRGARTISLPAGMRLDLGGIAKSWLAERLCSDLPADEAVLVDLGGDVRARGPWRVGVFHDRPLGVLEVQDEAVATSSIVARAWRDGQGRISHHVIDPRTRRPAATDLHSVTVVAPTCVEAEQEARAALILGSRGAIERLEARHLRAVLSRRDGHVVWLTNLEAV